MAPIDALFIIAAWLDDAEIEPAKQLELLQVILAQILSTVGSIVVRRALAADLPRSGFGAWNWK